jgi:hypothetical protein
MKKTVQNRKTGKPPKLIRQSKRRLRQGNFKEISYLKVEAGESISV